MSALCTGTYVCAVGVRCVYVLTCLSEWMCEWQEDEN